MGPGSAAAHRPTGSAQTCPPAPLRLRVQHGSGGSPIGTGASSHRNRRRTITRRGDDCRDGSAANLKAWSQRGILWTGQKALWTLRHTLYPMPSLPSLARTGQPVVRLYAIDWLRVAVMGVIYIFHVLRILDTDPTIRASRTHRPPYWRAFIPSL